MKWVSLQTNIGAFESNINSMQIIPVTIVPTHFDLARYFGLLCTKKKYIDEYIEYKKCSILSLFEWFIKNRWLDLHWLTNQTLLRPADKNKPTQMSFVRPLCLKGQFLKIKMYT